MELTVLGCSGSYGAPRGDACSGYLVQAGGRNIWCDCGNGTFVNLQRRIDPRDLDAVVITHSHPDHCVDIYGLHVAFGYGFGIRDLPVYAPDDVEPKLRTLVSGWNDVFAWNTVGDGSAAQVGDVALRFAQTDHPVPTVAVEFAHDGRRLVYTSDTGPKWSPEAFGPGADLVVIDASYLHADRRSPLHLSAHEAGSIARDAAARRLVLTHLWPGIEAAESEAEGSDAFGDEVSVACVGDRYTI